MEPKKFKGLWNGAQKIEYWAMIVRLKAVNQPPMHWQNAFAGQEREIIEIMATDGTDNPRFIDNADGTGVQKVLQGGTMHSFHRTVLNFDFLRWENNPTIYNPLVFRDTEAAIEKWSKENCPTEWEKVQQLKAAWENSPFKKIIDEQRKK